METKYSLFPRSVHFHKATGLASSVSMLPPEEGFEVRTVSLPSDHYDFAGPLKVTCKTQEEIEWDAAEWVGDVKLFEEIPAGTIFKFHGPFRTVGFMRTHDLHTGVKVNCESTYKNCILYEGYKLHFCEPRQKVRVMGMLAT